MRAVIQRVSRAQVLVNDQVVGQIGQGVLVLLGVGVDDGEGEAEFLARKTAELRIFQDEQGKMNRSVMDTGGQALVVSQFTLYGDTRKGRRPSYNKAAPPGLAKALYEHFVEVLEAHGVPTQTGKFQAEMSVSLVNEGPVTLLLSTDDRRGR